MMPACLFCWVFLFVRLASLALGWTLLRNSSKLYRQSLLLCYSPTSSCAWRLCILYTHDLSAYQEIGWEHNKTTVLFASFCASTSPRGQEMSRKHPKMFPSLGQTPPSIVGHAHGHLMICLLTRGPDGKATKAEIASPSVFVGIQ